MTSNDKEPSDQNKPNPDKDQRKSLVSAMIMSQFAYTLVIVSLVFGYGGYWLGKTFLGGEPMSTILMLASGSAGFALEVYRMITMTRSKKKDDDNN